MRVDIPSVGLVDFPDDMSDADIASAIQKNYPQVSKPQSSNTSVAINAASKGIAAVPDMLLNAPNNLLNLGKAAVGTVATAAGRPDLAPDLSANPDLARRGFEKLGFINPNVQPQGALQKGIDLLTQGAVGGALTGGAGLARTLVGTGMGALSAGAAGATEAVTGDPALAATAGLAVGGRGPKPLLNKNAVRDETLARAQKEGYVIPPSAVGGGSFLGNRVEGIGGKAAIGQEAVIRNQEVTNTIARREAGLGPNDPISEASLATVRAQMAAPYREVAALTPMAANALEKLQQTRAESKLKWAEYKRQQTVNSLREAQALDNKAQMYETAIERIARMNGKPDLVSSLREARMKMAKNYDVEHALNMGDGGVDATVIGRMLDKGKPLSDGLETIGRFAQAYGPFARDASKVSGPGVSKLEAYGALGLAGAGHLAGYGPELGLLPLVAPPLARSLMLSPMMQGPGSGVLSQVSGRTAPIATNSVLQELLRQQNQP